MKNVLLNPNPSRDIGLECTKNVVAFFKERGVNTFISSEIEGAESTGATLSDFYDAASISDLVISFGGDGTLLDTANLVTGLEIPVLGINIGRIGYMAELESHEICDLKNVLDGNYQIEERMMLDVSVKRNGDIVYCCNLSSMDAD